MQADMVGTIMAGRLEFRALMERGARMMDPEAEPTIYGNRRQAEAEQPEAEQPEQLQAVEAEQLQAVEQPEAAPIVVPAVAVSVLAPALQLQARNRRRMARRAQPLTPIAPLALGSDAF